MLVFAQQLVGRFGGRTGAPGQRRPLGDSFEALYQAIWKTAVGRERQFER
jgi:hypothetical protein